MSSKETAAERWARWKATKTQAPSSKQIRKVSDQRRHAQKASVKARHTNVRLRKKARAQAERQREESLYSFLRGAAQPSSHSMGLSNEDRKHQREHLEQRWQKYVGTTSANSSHKDVITIAPLCINASAVATVRQILRDDPEWVRATRGSRTLQRDISIPPKAWWDGKGYFILAMRIENSEYVHNPGAPHLHHVQLYYLKPYDLLEHARRMDMPAEAIPWAHVRNYPTSIELHGLPSPSLKRLAHEIKEYWRMGGRPDLF